MAMKWDIVNALGTTGNVNGDRTEVPAEPTFMGTSHLASWKTSTYNGESWHFLYPAVSGSVKGFIISEHFTGEEGNEAHYTTTEFLSADDGIAIWRERVYLPSFEITGPR